jgi:asparagine synthase (glutamine-hydrolysing)
MCGIAGIIGRLDEPNRAALKRMSDAMVHRGPDASGTWLSEPDSRGWGALLAHRRLSILDLSPAGAQPMVDPVTGHVVVFNGEIYNFGELRRRLEADGQVFKSTGDTAVMVRALGLYGPGAVSWLRGMFAFAGWDPKQRRILLARDPLGIKPLYIVRSRDADVGWSVAFASELRALLASELLDTPHLDPQAVASAVWNGFVVGPGTAVRGIDLLWPGRLLELDGVGREIRQEDFWPIPDRSPEPTMDENRLAAILEEGLRLHLASDVPLAVFLSGGVDSSVIANLAQRAVKSPIHTFTLAFQEQELNEGPIARRIAAAIGTQHHEVMLTEGHFVENLEAALDSLDQPTFDGLNAYYMSHAIRAAGFTVALSGTGGDELFGGYTSYRDLPVLQRWSRRAAWVPLGLRPAGPSSPTWSVAATIFWRSTSWPTRSSSPDFSVNSSRRASPRRWSTDYPWPCASGSGRRPGTARHSRPSALWSSGFSSASGCCVTTTLPAWPLRWSSGCRWWTRSSSRAWTACRIRRATGHWVRRLCCGASACADLTRRCSSGPRAGLCCRSIAGSGAA